MKLPDSPRVFITGAGSGLGRAIALELAPRRARLLLGDIEEARLEETAKLVREAGGTAEIIRCDVSQVMDVENAARRADELWQGVDLLVNNAGVAVAGAMGETPLADWEWIFKINLWGVIHGCHVFVPRMKARKSGWILNVSSAASFATLPNMAAYNVTKAGVVALSETLRAELAPSNIHVSVLCPTFFRTRLHETMRTSDSGSRKMADAFFRRARATAEGVAKAGVRGLEGGEFMIIPQSDGRVTWTLKRLAPGTYLKMLGRTFAARAAKKPPDSEKKSA